MKICLLNENELSETGMSQNGMSENLDGLILNGPSQNGPIENGPSANGTSGNVNDCLAGEAGVWAVDQDGVLWQRRGVGQHCPEGTMWASVCEVGRHFCLVLEIKKMKIRG